MNQLEPVETIEISGERYFLNPLEHWTEFVFRLDGGKQDGVFQVWAQGQLIATAKGWIGHRISEGMGVFQVRSYRDPADYAFTVWTISPGATAMRGRSGQVLRRGGFSIVPLSLLERALACSKRPTQHKL